MRYLLFLQAECDVGGAAATPGGVGANRAEAGPGSRHLRLRLDDILFAQPLASTCGCTTSALIQTRTNALANLVSFGNIFALKMHPSLRKSSFPDPIVHVQGAIGWDGHNGGGADRRVRNACAAAASNSAVTLALLF